MSNSRALAAVLSLAFLSQLCRPAQAARREPASVASRSAKQASTLVVYVYAEVGHRGSSRQKFIMALQPALRRCAIAFPSRR